MNEEIKNEEQVQEETKEEGIVEKAERLNQALDAKIVRHEALVAEINKARAENLLSGDSDAGEPSKEPVEETPEQYKDRVMRNDA